MPRYQLVHQPSGGPSLPLQQVVKAAGRTSKLLGDVRAFLIEEAQGHQKADRTKLNVNDIKNAKLHFFPTLDDDNNAKLEGKGSLCSGSNRGGSEITA